MTPEKFIAKWKGSSRTERSASQEHSLDLCELLNVPKPQDEDKSGDFYTFEKYVLKLDRRPGRADVWRKGCFAWEYKGARKNLMSAYSQLKEYADTLENPPLLIVSDMKEIRVHTNFTNSIAVTHTYHLPDLMSVEARKLLRNCFLAPENLRPDITRSAVTQEAAKAFGTIAAKLWARGYDARRVSHFLNRLMFCLFVEDVGLLSLVSFAVAMPPDGAVLDGQSVPRIYADLTAATDDHTTAKRLRQNADVAFMGDTKGGTFDIPGELARAWLEAPLNPNGRPNADVLRPWVNGMHMTRRSADKWIIDFGWKMSETEAALYERPFAHVERQVKPERMKNRREQYRKYWWRHVEPRPGMWRALHDLTRFIVTPEVSKHRVFTFLEKPIVPDHKLQVIARDDYVTFGILQSRLHELWALKVGSWHGVGNDPRYTIGTCFDTFPFPEGLTPDTPAADYVGDPHAQAIAVAASRLDELRRNWLNPPNLVYNQQPTWLMNAHRELDAAVAQAGVDIGPILDTNDKGRPKAAFKSLISLGVP